METLYLVLTLAGIAALFGTSAWVASVLRQAGVPAAPAWAGSPAWIAGLGAAVAAMAVWSYLRGASLEINAHVAWLCAWGFAVFSLRRALLKLVRNGALKA